MKKIIVLTTLAMLMAGQAMAQQAPNRNQSTAQDNSKASQSVEAITGGW